MEESVDLPHLRVTLVTKGLVTLSDSACKKRLDTDAVNDIRQCSKGRMSEPPFSLL